MRDYLVLFLFVVCIIPAAGLTQDSLISSSDSPIALAPTDSLTDTSVITIYKDQRVDLLVNKHMEINEFTTRNSRRAAPGFRLLVISSNNRDKVTDAKTKIYREFPELKSYMLYQSPFFRLKVGNFRERADAETYLVDVQRLFDTRVYIVPDTIEVRPELDN